MVTVLVLLCFDVTIIPPIPPLLFAVEVILLLKSKSPLFFFTREKREREEAFIY